mgnify:CR=1 FL=1
MLASMHDAGVRGGWAFEIGSFEVGPRLGAELTYMRADSFGATSPSHGSDAWLGLSGGALAAWAPIRLLALRLEVDATIPLSRPEFVVVGAGIVHKPPALTGRAGIGVGVRFF